MGLKEYLSELKTSVLFDENMKRHTTIGVGGNASFYALPDCLFSLNTMVSLAQEFNVKFKVVGGGSNLLVSDAGYNGLIICLKKLNDIFYKRTALRVMAGVSINSLIEFCASHGLSGVECLVGIPATVGGAVVMNAGAFGQNISKYVVGVETLCDGKIKKYFPTDCKFGYRKSRFLGGKEIVTAVDFDFPKCEKEIFEASVKSYRDLRRKYQPSGKTFGSVFKNPVGQSAGALIESVNLKGTRCGGAVISPKHANFIINERNATAEDIKSLIAKAKNAVFKEYGVHLKEEVEYVGI